jgi:hypothetical protein
LKKTNKDPATAERRKSTMRFISLAAFLSVLCLGNALTVAEGQLIPISQTQTLSASASSNIGPTSTNATVLATGLGPLSTNIEVQLNEMSSTHSTFSDGQASLQSQIGSSTVTAAGSFTATASGNNPPQFPSSATASSSYSLTFQVNATTPYLLSGAIVCQPSLGGAFVRLQKFGLPIFSVMNQSASFSNSGTLAAGQYTLTASASGTLNSANGPPFSTSGDFTFQFLLGSPSFQINSFTRQGNDMLLAWTGFGGTSNFVQAATGGPSGAYSNNFVNISPLILVPSVGATNMSYLDVGGATNGLARYYRVSQVSSAATTFAIDNAADPAYNGGWTNSSNGGTGFGPWIQTPDNTNPATYFIGSSTNNSPGTAPGIDTAGKSWGIHTFALAVIFRSFANGQLPVGGTFQMDMTSGVPNSGLDQELSIRSGNASASWSDYDAGRRLLFYNIGMGDYRVIDGTDNHDTGVPFIATGAHLSFTLGTNNTYTLLIIDKAGGVTNSFGGTLMAGSLDSIALVNFSAGSNSPTNDCFINSLQISE